MQYGMISSFWLQKSFKITVVIIPRQMRASFLTFKCLISVYCLVMCYSQIA